MEPIFAQLSLEYFLAGKTLPWNRTRGSVVVIAEREADTVHINLNRDRKGAPAPHIFVNENGSVYMVGADLSKAKSQYFNLRG